ncbi:hypothetical protein [uncultured Dokdonia sp.]|uniref:hypothetical protein n=1 Tax=uncultured Dokdonia sp. TaxID=575653 RepID=UPI002639FE3A|nr:hypothetical protein [uncultured Dokdonia sp.]
MKTLKNLQSYEIPTSLAKLINGKQCHNAVIGCIQTAIRDGNDFLVPQCYQVLCD